jgi:hypothetical protein
MQSNAIGYAEFYSRSQMHSSAIRLAQSKCRGEKTPVTQVSACVLEPTDFVSDVHGGQTITPPAARCLFTNRPNCYEPTKTKLGQQ